MTLDSNIITALANQFGVDASEITAQPLGAEALVTDSTQKYLVFIAKNQPPKAFVLISATKAPNAIKSAYLKLCDFAHHVGGELAQNLLVPLQIGESNGLSYSISLYHRPLHAHILLKYLDNWRVCASLMRWIVDVANTTQCKATVEETEMQFTALLLALSQANGLKQAYKNLILEAMEDIKNGAWQPVFVSAHNDLWRGNVLNNDKTKFVLIDWDGVTLKGYAFYDLVRVASSFKLSKAKFQSALQQYCGVLQCNKKQAKYYLISAFAFLYANLGDWQYERFLILLDDCMQYFEVNA